MTKFEGHDAAEAAPAGVSAEASNETHRAANQVCDVAKILIYRKMSER